MLTYKASPAMTVRRLLVGFLACLPFAASRAVVEGSDDAALKRKFRGIQGVVVTTGLVADNQPKKWVAAYTNDARQIFAASLIDARNRDNLAYTGGALPVPKTVRVTWLEGRPRSNDDWTQGNIIGDYTIEVASRIPDEVLDYIRAGRGRALRLKFRLKDDGVLLGWDVEESSTLGGGHVWRMPGGDFKEAVIFNGKLAEPGWLILPDGRKIDTNY